MTVPIRRLDVAFAATVFDQKTPPTHRKPPDGGFFVAGLFKSQYTGRQLPHHLSKKALCLNPFFLILAGFGPL